MIKIGLYSFESSVGKSYIAKQIINEYPNLKIMVLNFSDYSKWHDCRVEAASIIENAEENGYEVLIYEASYRKADIEFGIEKCDFHIFVSDFVNKKVIEACNAIDLMIKDGILKKENTALVINKMPKKNFMLELLGSISHGSQDQDVFDSVVKRAGEMVDIPVVSSGGAKKSQRKKFEISFDELNRIILNGARA